MFNKKKDRPRTSRKGDRSGNLSQFGLFDVPAELNFDGNVHEDINYNENESDLEEELLALTSGEGSSKKHKNNSYVIDKKEKAKTNTEEDSEDESVDENDPDLLNELSEITGDTTIETQPNPTNDTSTGDNEVQKILEARLEMYKIAEQNAKSAGETSRAKRFNRGIKQLTDLIKQAKQGKAISEEDIPPEVSTKPHSAKESNDQSQPSRAAPPPPPSAPVTPQEVSVEPTNLITTPEEKIASTKTEKNTELLDLLNSRKNEYKMAALRCKKSGDQQNALNLIRVAKQFEYVIKAAEDGQEIDLTQIPGPPAPVDPVLEQNDTQTASDETPENIPEPTLISAGNLLDDLQLRLEVYQKQSEKAKEENNAGKVRRMGRIVKQFEDAIKLHKSGKPVPLDELPTPPGYAPLISKPVEDVPKPPPAVPISPPSSSGSQPKSSVVRISGNHKTTTQADKQLQQLNERKKQFLQAALQSKKKGEIAEAKEFLKTAKKFDPLIEAAEGGLPIDFASLPLPPAEKAHLDNEVEIVIAEECTEDDQETLDVLRRLEQQLIKQIKMCIETRDHNKAIGDVAGANRFENLALNVTKDLDIIRLARKTTASEKSQIPKFHYETKTFSVVKTFTELKDNDLELSILRGVNYNCSNPNEIDTFVKYEFPWPQENPARDKTSVVKNTNNPEYNTTFWLSIDRKSRQCQRIFKRHGIKLEVYSKGGFFRGDTLLGTVTVKLQPLETQCEVHSSFDLLDGRKKVGGKLEVRIRLRDPILTKEVEQKTEKWLVIDSLN